MSNTQGNPPSSVHATPNGAMIPQLQDSEDSDMSDLGYFAGTETDEEDIEEVAEPFHRYNKKEASRVFYPVCIGEVLDKRYRIEHKIGHGGFSTVWLARDLKNKTDVALKILASSARRAIQGNMRF